MSADHFDSRKALANPTTENVSAAQLRPGDLVYLPEATSPDPWRIRWVDKFPGNKYALHGTEGTLLLRATSQPLGIYDGTPAVFRRVVL